MASLLVNTRGGVEAQSYQVQVCYERRRYKLPGWSVDSTGKELSAELGAQCNEAAAMQGEWGGFPGPAPLCRNSPRTRRSMANQGIIDPVAEGKALAEHVADFKTAMLAKCNTPDHVATTTGAVLDAAEACGFKMLGDVTPAKLRRYLAKRREAKPVKDRKGNVVLGGDKKPMMKPGVSARRHNAILGAMGAFFRWCIRERRAFENPIIGMSRLNEKTDPRHKRRALEPAEARASWRPRRRARELYGMSGAERQWSTGRALETGLRQNELRTLTRGCVDLSALAITVRAGYSKRRREDVQPIRADLATALKEFVGHKAPAARVFNMPNRTKMSRAFRADLAAAKIARRLTQRAGTSIFTGRGTRSLPVWRRAACIRKPRRCRARHSTITLTMDRYTHTCAGRRRRRARFPTRLRHTRGFRRKAYGHGRCSDRNPDPIPTDATAGTWRSDRGIWRSDGDGSWRGSSTNDR